MSTRPHLDRALLLIEQNRHEMAEGELRQVLADDPNDAIAHALLALCLSERKQFAEATDEVYQAIHLEPDNPFVHYAHGYVLFDRNRFDEALKAVEQAIQLNPYEPDYFSLLAAVHLNMRKWKEALAAAEKGMEIDAEHGGCINMRANALVKLGRREEAGQTLDATLAKHPEDAHSHANMGWTLLHAGNPKKALKHFQEAMRIDPSNEYARQGIVEALRAQNFVYALILKYFLFMSRLSSGAQWGIIVGGYLLMRVLSNVAAENEGMEVWVMPVRIFYITFALLTWTARPLFNLLLRLNRYGRLALSREEVVASNWFGVVAGAALLALGGYFLSTSGELLKTSLILGALLIPVSSIWLCYEGSPRKKMAVLALINVTVGLAAASCLVGAWATGAGTSAPIHSAGNLLMLASLLITFILSWVANVLISQQPKY